MTNFENYGFMCEKDTILVASLQNYKDMVLFLLEDFFFHNKLKKEEDIVSLPWITFITGYNMKPLKEAINLDMFKINPLGIEYQENRNYANVSPDFFAKIFIERFTEVMYAYAVLDKYQKCSSSETEEEVDEEKGIPIHFEDHIDFIEYYEFAKAMQGDILTATKGRYGLYNKSRAGLLRRLEIGAYIQQFIEKEFKAIEEEYGNELLSECDSNMYALSEAKLRLENYIVFDIKEITERLSNAFKCQIIKYRYPNSNDRDIKITKVGLDEMSFFSHPNDKVNFNSMKRSNDQYIFEEEDTSSVLELYPTLKAEEKSDRQQIEECKQQGKKFMKTLSFENHFDS